MCSKSTSLQLVPFERERTGNRKERKKAKKEERKEQSVHITDNTAVKTNFSLLCIRHTIIECPLHCSPKHCNFMGALSHSKPTSAWSPFLS